MPSEPRRTLSKRHSLAKSPACSRPGTRVTSRRSNSWRTWCIRICAARHTSTCGENVPHTRFKPRLWFMRVYLRLFGVQHVNWQNRVHFLSVCARLMRRVLIDFARQRKYRKRGGNVLHLSLDEALAVSSRPDPELLLLDEALTAMAGVDPRKAAVVELRFFGGLTVEETAAALSVSPETVLRDWRLAKPWLLREISR